MRLALVIAAKDLRLRLRDRTALITAAVAPLVIAVIMSTALGGFDHGVHARVAVLDEDHGPVAAAFLAAVEAPALRPTLTVVVASAPGGTAELADHSVGALIRVPAGFSNQAQALPPSLAVTTRRDEPVAGAVARAVADSFMTHLAAVRLVVETTAVAAGTGFDTAQIGDLARAATSTTSNTLTDASPGRRVPPGTYYAPAMAILFLFFTAGFGARSFLVERREHTLQRMLAAPVRPATVLAGKALATFVLGLGSMVFLYVTTTVFFGDRWGDPVAVVVLSAVVVAAIMAVTALAITFARTDEQAAGYTSFVTFVFGILGGSFIAVYQLPRALRAASALTPNGWAMRGFSDLAAGSGHLGTILVPLAAVSAFAVVVGAAALWRAPYLVSP